MTPDELLNGLDMVELVSGMVTGRDPDVTLPVPGGDPHDALEKALLGPLTAGPCGVAFSGGRDSSGVLAAAVTTARRHGLPDPVPITFVFPGVGATEEGGYQEAVIRHLGIDEWVRLEPGETLDVLGEASTGLTARHGMLFPSNIHVLVPLLEPFRGGALLTGAGGDEILGANPHHDLIKMLSGRRRPSRKMLRQVAKRCVAPKRDRNKARATAEEHLSWLVPEVRREAAERYARAHTDFLSASRRLTHDMYPARYIHRTLADMAKVAADHAAQVAHPLLDPGFVGALAGHVGRAGYRDRAGVMAYLFEGILPDHVNKRTTKARFDDVFWTRHAAEKSAELPVELLSDYVDPDAVRALWASDKPKSNTALIAKYLYERVALGHGAAMGRSEH